MERGLYWNNVKNWDTKVSLAEYKLFPLIATQRFSQVGILIVFKIEMYKSLNIQSFYSQDNVLIKTHDVSGEFYDETKMWSYFDGAIRGDTKK